MQVNAGWVLVGLQAGVILATAVYYFAGVFK